MQQEVVQMLLRILAPRSLLCLGQLDGLLKLNDLIVALHVEGRRIFKVQCERSIIASLGGPSSGPASFARPEFD